MAKKLKAWTDETIETFKGLCKIFCSREEICQVLRVKDEDLDDYCSLYLADDIPKPEPITFEDAFEVYSAEGKVSIRRTQYQLALDGDKTMLIWLGKQHLGQLDPDKGKKRPTKSEEKYMNNITAFRANSPVRRRAK